MNKTNWLWVFFFNMLINYHIFKLWYSKLKHNFWQNFLTKNYLSLKFSSKHIIKNCQFSNIFIWQKIPLFTIKTFFWVRHFAMSIKKNKPKRKLFCPQEKVKFGIFIFKKNLDNYHPFWRKNSPFLNVQSFLIYINQILSIFISKLCHNTLFGKNNQKTKIRKISTNLKKIKIFSKNSKTKNTLNPFSFHSKWLKVNILIVVFQCI